MVQVLFIANPKPSKGKWTVESVAVPFGKSTVDGIFSSSEVQNGSTKKEFSIELLLDGWENVTGNLFQLQVENDVGKADYNHTFSGDVDESHSPVVTKSQTSLLAIGIIIGI